MILICSLFHCCFFFFFFNDTATTEIYTLSLYDALPIWPLWLAGGNGASGGLFCCGGTDMTSKSRAGSIFRRCRTRFFSASPGSVETGHSPRTDRNCRCVSACSELVSLVKRRSADRAERLG